MSLTDYEREQIGITLGRQTVVIAHSSFSQIRKFSALEIFHLRDIQISLLRKLESERNDLERI